MRVKIEEKTMMGDVGCGGDSYWESLHQGEIGDFVLNFPP